MSPSPAVRATHAPSRREIFQRTSPTRGIDAGIAAECEHLKSGIVRQSRQADANAAARDFSAALPVKVVSVSSGSGRPRSPADTASTPKRSQERADFADFSRIVAGDHQAAGQAGHDCNTCLTTGPGVYIVYQ